MLLHFLLLLLRLLLPPYSHRIVPLVHFDSQPLDIRSCERNAD